MAGAPIELTVDQQGLAAVARVLKSEADGKTLRRDLMRALKATAEAPIAQARGEILAAPSQGLSDGVSLRSALAASIKPTSRLSGKQTGVSIRQGATPNLRGFKMAGRRFNRGSFRRPVYGGPFVLQQGDKDWFDRPMQAAQPEFKSDVLRVVQDLANTLAQRASAAARQ